jgi:hypothetical protein
MRKLLLLLLILNSTFSILNSHAQSPDLVNYQGVARDNAGNVLANQNIALRLSIHSQTPTGTVEYSEAHAVTTNSFGLFNVHIGGGTVLNGSMAGIAWGSSSHYIEVEIDPAGGTSYQVMGTSQLVSVPYALYAENSGTPGPAGPQGPTGLTGATGATGATGPLVAGTSGQTLLHDGNTWIATSNLYNDGSKIGIGTSTPTTSAIVEIASTTSGFVLPRMTTAQRNAISSPAAALQIYNTDNNCLETWNTNGWISLCGNGNMLFNGQATLGCVPNSWTQKADFGGTARFLAVGFSIGSMGYIGLGNDGVDKKDFWEYDPSSGVWTQKADFGGTARYGAVGFAIGSMGYVGTGYEAGFYKKDFWEYNPVSNLWTQKADFGGSERYSAVGFSIGSKGYIGTGMGNPYSNDFWEYDPGNDTWVQKASFTGGNRYAAVGFSIGSKGYIGTGYDNNPPAFKDFWEYNPVSNLWTQKADFGGTARIRAVGFSIGNKGYIGTGYDYTSLTKDFWEYDPSGNTWTQKTDFGGTARNLAVGFAIGSKGYIGTGSDGSNKNDFWEYCQ